MPWQADAQVQPGLLTVLLWSCFSITAHGGNAFCQQLFRDNYCLQRASSLLGCIEKSIASRSVEVILLCSVLVRHAWSASLVLGSPEQQWYGHSEKGQQRAINIMEILEYLSYEEKQRAWTTQPGEEKAQGNPTHV